MAIANVLDFFTQSTEMLRQHLLFDKSIWKWSLFFTGIYIGSQIFFYKLYYPTLLRTFSAPSFLHRDHNTNKKHSLSTQSVLTNAFPQSLFRHSSIQKIYSDSLYSQQTHWMHSKRAAGKFMSLAHAFFTAYKGLTYMKTLQLTPIALCNGVDNLPYDIHQKQPLIMSMINMNMAYNLTDLLLIYLPNPRGNAIFIIHHTIVLLSGITFKNMHSSAGAGIWLFGYGYADIPTIFYHGVWFTRNMLGIFKTLLALFDHKEVKQIMTENNIEKEIANNIGILCKVEKVVGVAFSVTFFYIRCVLFSRILPLWIWNTFKSPKHTLVDRMVGTSCAAALLLIGYWWGYNLLLELRDAFLPKAKTEEEQTENKEQIALLTGLKQQPKRLCSVNEEDSEA